MRGFEMKLAVHAPPSSWMTSAASPCPTPNHFVSGARGFRVQGSGFGVQGSGFRVGGWVVGWAGEDFEVMLPLCALHAPPGRLVTSPASASPTPRPQRVRRLGREATCTETRNLKLRVQDPKPEIRNPKPEPRNSNPGVQDPPPPSSWTSFPVSASPTPNYVVSSGRGVRGCVVEELRG